MSHIHWVARQNKLGIPRDKDEVNKRDFHECDGRAHDPDTMVAPLTPKSKLKDEAHARVPPTIASCREEDAALRKWPLPRYCYASCILETKRKVGSTAAKAPALRTKPKIGEAPTALGHAIDSGIGLSITIDKLRVFINKTLSILSAYQ
jgi:hypothetical protein